MQGSRFEVLGLAFLGFLVLLLGCFSDFESFRL